jgi:DNA-binding LacI/PurR family transcriptional regulator
LATVDKQNERLGAALAELLVERREGRLPDAPQHRLVEAKLVESCG